MHHSAAAAYSTQYHHHVVLRASAALTVNGQDMAYVCCIEVHKTDYTLNTMFTEQY
jgi:hypothetical protein